MKFATVTALFLAVITPSLGVTVSYDTVYDNGSNSLDIVACSDGSNGLEGLVRTSFLINNICTNSSLDT
jgi:hypothetical protein